MIEREVNYYLDKGGFALCIEGKAEIVINHRKYRMEPGCVYVHTSMLTFNEFKTSEDYNEISFFKHYSFYYDIFEIIRDSQYPLQLTVNPVWKLSDDLCAQIIRVGKLIKEKLSLVEQTENEIFLTILKRQIEFIYKETVLEVLYNDIVQMPSENINYDKNHLIAYQFLSSLHQNYKTHRSVSWYADKSNLSTGHFSTIIKKTLGLTPQEFISKVVIGNAKLLLKNLSLSIKEIAVELNFPEQFTFGKYFKKYTNQSPTEYRKQSTTLKLKSKIREESPDSSLI